jgi:hypothetical protein
MPEMRIRMLVAAMLVAAGGCGFSSQPLEPLVVGSQQFFSLEWSTGRRGNQPLVQGYIRNNWGFAAANMRLLVDALDPPDRLVSQRLIWLGGQLTPGTRAYFETVMPPASTYRVRVFAYDWVQSPEMFGR